MRLPHGSLILVADGRKMLFFRNKGEADYPNLIVEEVRAQDNPPDRVQSADRPGRTFSSPRDGRGAVAGNGRSAYSETDFHALEESRFAIEAAHELRRRALAGEYNTLVIVAPPRTLGDMRKHYHKEVESRLASEIAKDLTGHPVEQIEKILTET